MSKRTSAIVGVNFKFRTGAKHDAFRAWVFKNGEYKSISAKLHPTLKQLNKLLKDKKLREATAQQDPDFVKLKQKLEHELRSEFGLATYKAIEKIDLKTKEFDFETSLEDFEVYKKRTSVPVYYRRIVEFFWLPFFMKEKNCIHPSEFTQHQKAAVTKVIKHKNRKTGKPISFHSYNSYFKALNQYMDYCLEKNDEGVSIISKEQHFKLWYMPTPEEMKKGLLKKSRRTDTYELDELIEMKKKIDRTYDKNPKKKLEAYGYLFGVYSGMRQGNILGMKAEDLFPEHEIPHFRVSDNIVSGYGRGESGPVVFENATKTTSQEDGEILLPMIQPDRETIIAVAKHLKKHLKPKDRICPGTPGGFYRKWKRIANECNFKFLNPHNWKHSYATNGADKLEDWYNGNPRLLQICCLHANFSMTEKYIKRRYPKTLELWRNNK